MFIEVVVGEVHVVEFGHVQGCQHSIELARLMHELMRHCELGGGQVGGNKDHGQHF